MAVINTNTKALFSQMALKISGRDMAKSMEQLSTGKRINSGGDDAAGLAIATRMTQQIRSLNQAVRNAGDATSLIQTTEGATNEITEMLQRMRELAIQAINDTNSNEDRSYLDLEFQQLKQEIVRVAGTTEWNGFKVLDGTAGERVGEMPVFKSTSVALSGDLLINPTTLRTVSGTDAGEQQTVRLLADMEPTVVEAVEIQDLTFTAPAPAIAAGTTKSFSIDGVTVVLTSEEVTAAQVAAKVATTFNNSFWVGERQEITFTAPTAEGEFTVGGVTVSGQVGTIESFEFNAATASGNITVGGVTVAVVAGDTAAQVAAKVKAALDADGTFSGTLGAGGIVDNGDGTLTVEYDFAEGDVFPTAVADTGTTGAVTALTAVTEVREFADNNTADLVATAAQAAIAAAQTAGTAFLNANVTRDGATLIIEFPASDGDAADIDLDFDATGITATPLTTREYGDRQVVDNEDGTVTFTFATADGEVLDLALTDGVGAAASGVTITVEEVAQGIPEITENFTATGRYLQAGTLSLQLDAAAVDGEVEATFTTADGQEITLTGTLQTTTGTVTFSDALGENEQVISGAVTYTFTDGAAALSLAAGAGNGLPLRLNVEIDDSPQSGQVKVGGITIQIREGDAENSTTFASRVKAELERSSVFASGTGRSITQIGNELTITYASTDGDFDDIEIVPEGTGIDPQITEVRAAVALADELVSSGGEFKHSGSLSLAITGAGEITARFLTNANESIRLTAELDALNGQVILRELDDNGRPVGLNSQVISGTVTYTLMDSASDAISVEGRAVSLSVDIEGGIPAMRAGDLQINGVEIGASYPADDTLSPRNNAAGSAIAKAAAINRKAGANGATVGESQSITFAGVPKPGQLTVAGVSILITENDNTVAKVASKVASALRVHPNFELSTGRTISHAIGSSVIHFDFPASERDVPKTEILPGTTNLTAVVDVTREYATSVPGTGVYAKVNENVVLGQEMSANSVVTGVVFVNGFASADITTTLNNTRESRKTVVDAINAITYKTGVKAVDTGSDLKGVTLTATDGRNIEVRFETLANNELFGRRTGLREGVQASTISLESKVDTPVVLTSSSTGDISRVGLLEGNFSRNESVVNTAPREPVLSPFAQTQSITISGDATANDVYNITINGQTFSHKVTAGNTSAQAVRDGLLAAISANEAELLGVQLTAGRTVGELLVTAEIPGEPFTISSFSSTGASAEMASRVVAANQPSEAKSLGQNDLVINGIKIRSSVAGDDTVSSITSLSSDRASSAIAIAAAINSHSSETGVRALPNAVISKGGQTSTLVPDTGTYLLYVNGTEVEVPFVKAETAAARRSSVITAINERTGQHGVTASDNGRGVTLTSDGRNLSVWFDGNIENLSASSFGLEKGGSVAQVSRISLGGTVGTETATVSLNGVSITSAAAANSAADLASKLATAITYAITADELLDERQLANLEVVYTGGDDFIEIVSTIPGTDFDLRGASVSADGPTLNLSTVTSGSVGLNDVQAIRGATDQTATAKTLYGTVRLISDPKLLPEIPSPLGSPPSDQLSKINATGKPIEIKVGDRGFSESGAFVALGFQQGMFGGRASEALDPPKVGRMAFQVGASAGQLITIDLADFGKEGSITSSITGDVDLYVEDRTNRINSRDGATAVLEKLDDVMDKINASRAQMGAVMNRLEYAMNNLSNVSMNQEASRSQIQDADYAKASTELAKNQIMQQAATAVLAQANMSNQTVLQLLQG
jgi:flagellin